MRTYTLTKIPEGYHLKSNHGSWPPFAMAQEAIDFFYENHPGETLIVLIDHRIHADYLGRPV